VDDMARRCGMAARDRDALLEIKEEGAKSIEALANNRIDNSSLYHLLRPLRLETLLFIMADAKNSSVKERISLFMTELVTVRAGITGKDLESLGIEPGPVYTDIIRAITDERLQGRILGKEDEIAYIKKNWKKGHGGAKS